MRSLATVSVVATIRRWGAVGAMVLLGTVILTGCVGDKVDTGEVEPQRVPVESRQEMSTADPDLVTAALQFGELRLPPSATVVWAGTERGIDQLYTLVIELDPAEVDQLLGGSGFTAQLREQRPVSLAAPPGFDPADTTDFASGQDRLEPTDDHPEVFREVLIDWDDPDRTRVYWWLFTT